MKIAIIGLGYVGLPLAVELSKEHEVIGYDINEERVNELKDFNDSTDEIRILDLIDAVEKENLRFTDSEMGLKGNDVFIVTVPTPITKDLQPDFSAIISATETIGNYVKRGCLVIYESTVYPTATEDICIPILEKLSGLNSKFGFGVGYSPERINPGDKDNTLLTITKVVSATNLVWLNKVREVYESIGINTHPVSNLKTAEAAKVVENIQRDVNIALMNELSVVFDRLDIDTKEVLDACGTKWNFLNFTPGLVGGHCIGVDPYYLIKKSEDMGYSPNIIKNSRIVNEKMVAHVLDKTLWEFRNNYDRPAKRILILGMTFKENCPDIRNSKAIDIINKLYMFGKEFDIYDPVSKEQHLDDIYLLDNTEFSSIKNLYDAVIITVAHKEFKLIDFSRLVREEHVIMDIRNLITEQQKQFLNVITL